MCECVVNVCVVNVCLVNMCVILMITSSLARLASFPATGHWSVALMMGAALSGAAAPVRLLSWLNSPDTLILAADSPPTLGLYG